jgi:phosphoribosylformylglycinamidine (FGAM) synthase PurS component
MARFALTLTVTLKVADNEARSALEAIQVKMDLADQVSDLSREDRWELEVEAESVDAADSVVRELVERTNLFANPNKHRYVLCRSGAGGGGSTTRTDLAESESGATTTDLAENEVAILVSDRESAEGASILSATQRLGVANVVSARKWVRWRVGLTRTPVRGEPDLFELIRRIGVTTSRRDGLLSNPHSQISRAVLPWGEEKPLES